MALSERALTARARRAFELGRLRAGLASAAVVFPMTLASLLVCRRPFATVACGATLALIVAAFVWKGGGLCRGVRPGLLAGLPPLLIPAAVPASGHACSESVCASLVAACAVLPAACVAGGIAAGAILAIVATRRGEGSGGFWISAGLITALVGSLGCLLGGAAGLAGMGLGLLTGAAPVLVARRA